MTRRAGVLAGWLLLCLLLPEATGQAWQELVVQPLRDGL